MPSKYQLCSVLPHCAVSLTCCVSDYSVLSQCAAYYLSVHCLSFVYFQALKKLKPLLSAIPKVGQVSDMMQKVNTVLRKVVDIIIKVPHQY